MLELKRMQGKMVDAEEAIALFRRTNAYAATVFKTFHTAASRRIAGESDDRTRVAIFIVAQKVINQSRKMLAE